MDNHNIRRFTRSTRVQNFGRVNAADFASGSRTAGLFLELDPVIVKLTDANVGQLRAPVGKPARIEALSSDFKDISRTSRAIKIDEPDFADAAYRHPATSSETPVTTHADSLLKLLEDDTSPVTGGGDTPDQLAAKAALREKFIAYELPADFVEDLRADRDALAACNTGKHSDNLECIERASAIETLLAQAQSIISRLDAGVQNRYLRDPDKLAAWKSASRTERAAKKAEAPVTPPPVL